MFHKPSSPDLDDDLQSKPPNHFFGSYLNLEIGNALRMHEHSLEALEISDNGLNP